MTTQIAGIDLAEFKRQQAIVTQHAIAGISDRIGQINTLLDEIETLSTSTGTNVDLEAIVRRVSDVDSFQAYAVDWNSSSC